MVDPTLIGQDKAEDPIFGCELCVQWVADKLPGLEFVKLVNWESRYSFFLETILFFK